MKKHNMITYKVFLVLLFIVTINMDVVSAATHGPLHQAFLNFEAIAKTGCDVDVLPDAIDWCDDSLNKHGRLPENTVCQSIYSEDLYLICRYTQWRPIQKHHDRERRSIGLAYKNDQNVACMFFCASDNTTADGTKVPPQFTFCPASTTSYPEGTETEVMFNWREPEADDVDGEVKSLEQIIGEPTSSSFQSAVTPGVNHIISYLATDNDNLNWTCSFTLTSEIPMCEPLPPYENGLASCTDDTFRASTCRFLCNAGYIINGTLLKTTCLDDGTWSHGGELPECTPLICDIESVFDPFDNSTDLDPNLQVVCGENITGEYGSVCWLECNEGFQLRNDELEDASLNLLTEVINAALDVYNVAQQEADEANEAHADAAEKASEIYDLVNLAENVTDNLQSELDDELEELTNLLEDVDMKRIEVLEAEQKLDDEIAANGPNVDVYREALDALREELAALNDLVEEKDALTVHIQEQLNAATAELEASQKAFDQASLEADELGVNASVKATEAQHALEAFQTASALYHESTLYSQSTYKNVPTYVRCEEDAQWSVAGSPYCLDVDPPIVKCLPVVTHYLEQGQTSGEVTWSEPEVDDVRNVTMNQLEGPSPGDLLGIGKHVVKYQAVDDDMKQSPVCMMVINVQVHTCGDLAHLIDDPHLRYNCASFELGAVCSLSCDSKLYPISGPNTVTCLWNTDLKASYWDWHNTTCNVDCADPLPPDHGIIDCRYDYIDLDNSTDNSSMTFNLTEGLVCLVTCDLGYMLPYGSESLYFCGDDGKWNTDYYPSSCLAEGDEKFATYEVVLQYSQCDAVQVQMFIDQLPTEVMSYQDCMAGYMCDIVQINGACDTTTKQAEVYVNIKLYCEFIIELPWEAACDLELDKTQSLTSSLQQSFDANAAFETLTFIEATIDMSVEPSCRHGTVLAGTYCAMCEAGMQYIQISRDDSACVPCNAGSYTLNPGSFYCTNCPGDHSTQYTGASNRIEQCKGVCEAGTFSNSMVQPCLPCSTGSYLSTVAGQQCEACPTSTWTTSEGSASAKDCIDYDLYFDGTFSDVIFTNLSDVTSVVFWTMTYYTPDVTVSFCPEGEDACTFALEVSGLLQLTFGWENEPIDVTMETDKWSMYGVIWDVITNTVTVYKDAEMVTEITIDLVGGTPDSILLSIGDKNMLSGLSVSRDLVTANQMATMFDDCSAQLEQSVYTLDDLAAIRHHTMRYAASTCKASNASIKADHCALHTCQNGGTCRFNASETGYTCNCMEQYGGVFCEEELVHGNWSEWLVSGGCSVSCGNGTQLLHRYCNNPPRSEFGDDCDGNSTDVIDCVKEDCPTCDTPVVEGIAFCDLEDELCTATCPPGYVLPRGQDQQTFQCGESTGFNWTPLPYDRLPICAESVQPSSYTLIINFTFGNPIPCDEITAVTQAFKNHVVATLRCFIESDYCTATVEITGCSGQRRKRSTDESVGKLELTIPLHSNVPFDLPEYYRTNEMTESIQEAVTAIAILENTALDILNGTDLLTTTVGSKSYTVTRGLVYIATTTDCASGQAVAEAVCAKCQKGTYEHNGRCVYCDRGSYQDQTGQSSCHKCPDDITDFIGGREAIECIELPKEPPPYDYTEIIIIVVTCLLFVAIVVLVVICSKRFYKSSKDRQKHDMEADRISLYTDFADIAYNIYFKRRQVVGFDEEGCPIIEKLPTKNGDVMHADDVSLDGGSPEPDDKCAPAHTKELFAYPEQSQKQLPCQYDPYEVWSDDFVHPYTYPPIDDWDFPKIEQAIRYRIPGRAHLAHAYPFTQFGYTERVKGRCRKNLPLPANIPVPKHLPQLMYRPPENPSITDILKGQFGIQSIRGYQAENATDPLINGEPGSQMSDEVPPLPFKKKANKLGSARGRRKVAPSPTPTSVPRSTPTPFPRGWRSASATPRSVRSESVVKAGEILKLKLDERSPRTVSAMSPRSVLTDGSTPRPATAFVRSARSNVGFHVGEDAPHPKPTRLIVPTTRPYPPKSALKGRTERRPSTSLTTGRKSVFFDETVKDEEGMHTRPSTAAPSRYSSAGMSPFKYNRPSTDAVSARETIVAPYAARPRIDHSHLPPELTETYRPTSSVSRPMTPAEHPRPVLHTGVTVKRTSDYSMFKPPPTLEFNRPPTEQTLRMFPPPPFLNKGKPDKVGETATIVTKSGKRVTLNLENDDDDDINNPFGSFFLTELPSARAPSRPSTRASGRRSSLKSASKWGKKSSPPPEYSKTRDHSVIETGSIFSQRW